MKYKFIILGLVALFILVGIVAFFVGKKDPESLLVGDVVLWSFEDRSVWKDVIDAFEGRNTGIKIIYRQKSRDNYEVELLNALAAGRGPDIFLVHNTWLQKHMDKIMPFPEEFMTVSDFLSAFVDVTSKDLIRENTIYAMPFYVDTLALFYNKDIFNSSGIALPPKTWEDFNNAVKKTTQISSSGVLVRPGAGIGTANNVEHSSDLLTAIMFQAGTKMLKTSGRVSASFDEEVVVDKQRFSPGEDSLVFYTDFANPTKVVYTWNRGLKNSRDLFTDGGLAMYFGYSTDIPAIAKSNVDFGIAPLPQIKDKSQDPAYRDANYADYWALAVNKATPLDRESLAFIAFMADKNNVYSFLESARLPAARRDLVDFQSSDVNLGVFAKQSLIADSWLEPDHDKITTLFNKMIEDVVLNRLSSSEAIVKTAKEVTNLIAEIR